MLLIFPWSIPEKSKLWNSPFTLMTAWLDPTLYKKLQSSNANSKNYPVRKDSYFASGIPTSPLCCRISTMSCKTSSQCSEWVHKDAGDWVKCNSQSVSSHRIWPSTDWDYDQESPSLKCDQNTWHVGTLPWLSRPKFSASSCGQRSQEVFFHDGLHTQSGIIWIRSIHKTTYLMLI